MLTLFTAPKPFNDQFGIIQTNAIRSWTRLHPGVEVILFGDEPGAADAARLLNVQHVPSVKQNEYGTPLVNDFFEQAKRLAKNPILVYANADIILMRDFVEAVEQVATWRNRYLIIGQRVSLNVTQLLEFGDGWEGQLRSLVNPANTIYNGVDCFTFNRYLFDEMPPFSVGRGFWEFWPIYAARVRKAAVVDITTVVTMIHQDHDYSHIPGGVEEAHKGIEAERNKQLLGGMRNHYSFLKATHSLTSSGIKVRCRSCYPACVCNPYLRDYDF